MPFEAAGWRITADGDTQSLGAMLDEIEGDIRHYSLMYLPFSAKQSRFTTLAHNWRMTRPGAILLHFEEYASGLA
jgi:hypothetical protein